jgi:uncharacterized NAD(P)/FAD-binding protein YdhS
MNGRPFNIGIIGAGFSGALLAVHLLRYCRPDDRIYLIEKRAGFGRGLAYSTTNQNHLLNVRAGNMSAFADRPEHFVDWLQNRLADDGDVPADADSFVSRRLYGTYVRSLLCDELWSGGKGPNLFLVPDQAVSLHEAPDGVSLTVAGGRCYRLDIVVLAGGNLPADRTDGAYFGDPWNANATSGIPKHAPVLLIGTGLTMVDVVQSLLGENHCGPIRAISRRGLLPQVHSRIEPVEISIEDLPRTTSLVRLMGWLRHRVRSAQDGDLDWRSVVDGLRPHTTDLWRRLPLNERQRFLRHLRPWWDTHRHRMAPAVNAQLQTAIASGQLHISAARVVDVVPSEVSVQVTLRPRHKDNSEVVNVARVINCSGPETDFKACRDPLVRDLLLRGFARPDPLGLGLEVSEQGALLNGTGQPSSRLFALGPLTRGSFWEIVAVPDIRMHCARLANHLATRLYGRGNVEAPVRRPIVSSQPLETRAEAASPGILPSGTRPDIVSRATPASPVGRGRNPSAGPGQGTWQSTR